MDLYSSGEDLVVKTRKPYTVSKQRERWTEEEHNRFLGALKLYGRAWQRIEEHIGTKTAVQIRSHAQKFFSKLEKEAIVKGVPIGHALDIDIPPPRPKRKPNNPYPRKSGAPTPEAAVKIDNTPSPCSIFSSCRIKPTMALEKESGEEANGEKSDDSHHKHQAVPRPFESPGDAPKKMRAFTQYAQLSTETSNVDVAGTSQITVEAGEPNSLHCRNILESSVDETGPNTAPVMPGGAEACHCTNTSRPSNQPFSGYHYPPIGSFLHVSSMFSSLVVSALLQNPASYAAAAGCAATLWTCKGGRPPSTASPSMAEIAAATVAAATAWWASHGLLTMHPQPQVVRSSESEANPSVIEVPAKNANTEAKQATKNEMTENPFDRSSCYSNTASGSDAAAEKKSEDDIKHMKEGDVFEDLFTRRCRSTSNNISDYWKEVSEEGQLAFQALFSRDVLPQSFSPPSDDTNNKGKKTVPGEEDAGEKVENDNASATNVNIESGFLNMGLGLELGLAKLKPRRTGFKPYKRCSMEGRESRVSTHNPDEERGPKRRCIGEAST